MKDKEHLYDDTILEYDPPKKQSNPPKSTPKNQNWGCKKCNSVCVKTESGMSCNCNTPEKTMIINIKDYPSDWSKVKIVFE